MQVASDRFFSGNQLTINISVGWARGPVENNKPTWTCTVCLDRKNRPFNHLDRHEKTNMHKSLVQQAEWQARLSEEEGPDVQPPFASSSSLAPKPQHFFDMVDGATRSLLRSLGYSGPPNSDEYSPPPPEFVPAHSPPSLQDRFNESGWGLFGNNDDTELVASLEVEGAAAIARSILQRFDDLSDDSEEERSDVDEREIPEPVVASLSFRFHISHAQILTPAP